MSADEGETIKVRVSFTDDAENAESLTSAATDAVAAAPKPLTASFSGMPSEHAGEGETFTFGLTFSEEFGLSYKTLRDEAFDVRGGEVRRAKRKQQGSNQSWTITVEPDSHAAVTVRLPAGSVETADGRGLERAVSATVAGPVGIAVADARVDENGGAPLAFAVTLSRPASERLTVDYATADGSAQAGMDYTAASGTLTFQGGRIVADGQRDGTRRLARRYRGDADADVVEPVERPADGRRPKESRNRAEVVLEAIGGNQWTSHDSPPADDVVDDSAGVSIGAAAQDAPGPHAGGRPRWLQRAR